MNNEAAIRYILSITSDPYPSPDYKVCHTPESIDQYLLTHLTNTTSLGVTWKYLAPLGQDTESLPDHTPYCLTFSAAPGTGRLIYARDRALLAHYRARISHVAPLHIFHNYLHDINPFDFWEIEVEQGRFMDTMVRAYNLCLGGGGDDEGESRAGRGSLGLKALAFRFLNMRMTSFKDTVFPHSIPRLLVYLQDAGAAYGYEPASIKRCQCGCLQTRHLIKGVRNLHHGSCTGCRDCPRYRAKKRPPLTEEEDRLNRLQRKATGLIDAILTGKCERDQDDEDDIVNPWKRIAGWHDYDREALLRDLGPWPVPSIEHVPEPELIQYAVRDADATLRLYLFLLDYRPWIFY